MKQIWGALIIAVALLVLPTGCGEVAVGDDAPVLRLVAQNLDTTAEVFFTVRGDGIVDAAVGARGSFPSDGTSTVSFSRLPEGAKYVEVFAWDSIGYVHESPLWNSNPGRGAYRLTEIGNSGDFNIQGTRSQNLGITATAAGSNNVKATKWMINGQYTFDANDQWAGSIDGSNWAVIMIDEVPVTGSPVPVRVEIDDSSQDAAGLFTAIPPTNFVYPDLDSWTARVDGTISDEGSGIGGFAVAIMAMPGTAGRNVKVQVSIDAGPFEDFWIRVAGLGNLTVRAEGP